MKNGYYVTRDSFRLEAQNLRKSTIYAINRILLELYKYEDIDYKAGYNAGMREAVRILREEIRENTGNY
jgi:predicted DNA-binding transcriptional regulator YafY